MKRIAIVGGGITGLAAAHRLQKKSAGQPIEIQILEASSRLGGTLHTTARDGFLLEGGPDSFLTEKPAAARLCEELGLSDQILPTETENRRSFILRGGTLYPVPEGFYLLAPTQLRPFLASPLLSWRGKWRVLWESLLPSRPQNDESVASFVRRRLGQEALDWLAQPLLAGIYAADPEVLSLQATFPRFLEMERKSGSVLAALKTQTQEVRTASGARYSLFVTLKSGMQRLADRLAQSLPRGAVRLNTAVTAVRRKSDGTSWQLQLTKGQTVEADAIILALPAYGAGALLFAENAELSDQLKKIEYISSAVIHYAFKEQAIRHPLDGFGFVVPKAEKRHILACTFVHKKFSGRASAGFALFRAFAGGALNQEILRMDDIRLEQRIGQDLREILGITEPPIFSGVERWPRAIPQYAVGHLQRVLTIEETVLGLPGLALAGNWQYGVGIPDCVESGQRAADQLLDRIIPAGRQVPGL